MPPILQAKLPPMAAADAGGPPAVTSETMTAAPDAGMQAQVPEVSTDAWPADCQEHFVFHAHGRPTDVDPSKYTLPAGDERVATFYFKSPWSNPAAQLVQSRERLDDRKIIHHWMLYLINNTEHPDGDILDDHNLQSFNTLLNQQSLVGGIPGSGDLTLPEDVGLRLPDNEQTYALSIHYLNTTDEAQYDASGIEVCVTNQPRPHEAATHWVGASTFMLPPRTETRVNAVCNPTALKQSAHILSISPHMHLLGTQADVTLQRASGATVNLLDVPYSFDDQKVYDITKQHPAADLELAPGDHILTTCTFNNTTDMTVANGEKSAEEMCIMGIIAWPAGSISNDSQIAGFAGLSEDQSCFAE